MFHGRVRDGNGCRHPAITTRSAKSKFEKLEFDLFALTAAPIIFDDLACAGAPHVRRRPVGLAVLCTVFFSLDGFARDESSKPLASQARLRVGHGGFSRRYCPRCPQVSGAAAFNREDIK